MNERQDLQGLGGWLILVGIGAVVGPFQLLFIMATLYLPIFSDGTWSALTTAGSEYYNALWAPILVGEIAFNTAMIAASFYLMYLFFSKQRNFPRLYIAIAVVSLVFIPIDAWFVSFVLPGEPMFDPETAKEFARTAVVALIWIPYMLVSKRVKATFVNPVEEGTEVR